MFVLYYSRPDKPTQTIAYYSRSRAEKGAEKLQRDGYTTLILERKEDETPNL